MEIDTTHSAGSWQDKYLLQDNNDDAIFNEEQWTFDKPQNYYTINIPKLNIREESHSRIK